MKAQPEQNPIAPHRGEETSLRAKGVTVRCTSDATRPYDGRKSERGYTLVALLAVMSILAITLAAAAPSLQQQAQRERELEAIYRGEQVADAIRLYYDPRSTRRGERLSSIDQLKEGVQIQGRSKRIQILRPSAARDPLSEKGEWVFVGNADGLMPKFYRSVVKYSNGKPPEIRPEFQAMAASFAQQGGLTKGTFADDEVKEGKKDKDDDSGDSETPTGAGIVVGVTSSSKSKSIVNYYGIAKHNRWVFTPVFKR